MNVYNAVMETVVVSPVRSTFFPLPCRDHSLLLRQGFLLLNDTRNFNPIHEITVKNTGSKTVTLKISHDSAGTALTFVEGSTTLHKYANPSVALGSSSDSFPLQHLARSSRQDWRDRPVQQVQTRAAPG
jgi:hypothetical protein